VEGQVVSLADRLDTLCAYLSIGLTATGSEDPYGLRRTAQGAARILLEGDLDLSLSPLLGTTFEALAEGGKVRMESARAEGEALRSLNQRIQQWLLDQGLPRDVVDAAMRGEADRPREVRERALAVGELLRKDERMAALAVAATRVSNILRSGKAVEELGKHDGGPTEERLQQEAERTLYAICRKVERDLSGHGCRVDYGRLLRDLTPLVAPINRFFDDVMVMTEDSELRANRLALLRQVQSALMRFGDLSRLEMDGATGKWLGGGQ
jgi:glycyl-tRNA synthetase beta chain